jgi:hypothetical protein
MSASRRCGLAVALLAALGCEKTIEKPHGSPVLLEAYWEIKGIPTRIWSRDADASVTTTVPPQGTRVDFVFDRSLDGARIEDTIDGSSASKANPPITASWPDIATVMSDPPFASDVLYNSLADWGPGTSYAFMKPHIAGFPSATTVTFTLDPNGLTSVYGEPMDGPTTISVTTGAFALTLPSGTATAPTSYRVPIAFSTRAPQAAPLTPFIHVLDGVNPLAFDLANDMGDSTLVYIIARDCNHNWPPATEITIFADDGLPDAFGRPLAVPVAGRFTTAPIGGCGGSTDGGAGDSGVSDGATDAVVSEAGNDDGGAGSAEGGPPDGGAGDDGPPDVAPGDAPDDVPQSN